MSLDQLRAEDIRAAWQAAARFSRDGSDPFKEWAARQNPLCREIKHNALLGLGDRLIAWHAQLGRTRLEVLDAGDDAPRKVWLQEQVELQQAEIQHRIAVMEHIQIHGMPLWPGEVE